MPGEEGEGKVEGGQKKEKTVVRGEELDGVIVNELRELLRGYLEERGGVKW